MAGGLDGVFDEDIPGWPGGRARGNLRSDGSLGDWQASPEVVQILRVPDTGPGVCRICRAWISRSWTRCWSCARVAQMLGSELAEIRPVSLGTKSFLGKCSPRCTRNLYAVIRAFKAAYSISPDDAMASREASILVSLIEAFLCTNFGSNVLGEKRRLIMATVPSSRGRRERHPLEALMEVSRTPFAPFAEGLLRCSQPVARQSPSSATNCEIPRFQSHILPANAHVVLVEDVVASGLRPQAAAMALVQAGAISVTVVPIVRLLGPRSLALCLARSGREPCRSDARSPAPFAGCAA